MNSMEKNELIMNINDAMKRSAIEAATAFLMENGIHRTMAIAVAEYISDECDLCDAEAMAEKIEEFLGEFSA